MHRNYNPTTKGQTIIAFFACVFGTAALGWLCLFLAGAMRYTPQVAVAAMPGAVLSAIIWTAFYVLAGLSLFLQITAKTHKSVYRTVKTWSLIVWGFVAGMMFVWPFLMFGLKSYTLAFVWLAVSASLLSALIVLCFKLRPAAGFMLLPLAAWMLYSVGTVLYLVINV